MMTAHQWVGLLCTLQQGKGPLGEQEAGQLFAELLKQDCPLHYRVVWHAAEQVQEREQVTVAD